jgi:hypothetical protein
MRWRMRWFRRWLWIPPSLPASPSRLWFAHGLRLRSACGVLRLRRSGSRTELRLRCPGSRSVVLCAGPELLCSGPKLLCARSVLRLRRPGALRCSGDHGPAAGWRHDRSSSGTWHGTSDCPAAAAGRAVEDASKAEGLIDCLGAFRPIDRCLSGRKLNKNGFARKPLRASPFLRAPHCGTTLPSPGEGVVVAEIRVVRPRVIVCLGATAAQTLLGFAFRITKQRGRLMPSAWSETLLATHHRSAALRAPHPEDRHRMRDELVADLRIAAAAIRHKRN